MADAGSHTRQDRHPGDLALGSRLGRIPARTRDPSMAVIHSGTASPVRAEDSASSGEGPHNCKERAYAAVLYLKTSKDDNHVASLITAKSKVAPLKQVSLPRLELSAAMLLARLVEYALTILDLKDVPLYLWTDSMVTLYWIQGHPSQ